MNRSFERIKRGCQRIWNHKVLSSIPISCLLLLIAGLQAVLEKLASAPFPYNSAMFLFALKAVWVCMELCGVVGLLALLGTPFLASKYEKPLSEIHFLNHSTEPPMLVSKQKTENGLILEYFSKTIPTSAYEKSLAEMEAALNLGIIEICKGQDMQHTLIKAISGDINGQPHIIPWSNSYLSDKDFVLVLGKTPFGMESVDIATVPHLAIGGGSGSGKSLLLKLLIFECVSKGGTIVHIVDMKGALDFNSYFHQKCNIITGGQQFLSLLEEILSTMEERRHLLVAACTPNIAEYNKKSPCPLPRIIIACDEIAEILDKTGLDKEQKVHVSKIESALSTIARQGRAFGIRLILSTQRPDAEILKGQIRTNVSYRVCGRADKILSQIILDDNSAAEKIPPDSQGLFCTNMGTLFQAFYLDESQLE